MTKRRAACGMLAVAAVCFCLAAATEAGPVAYWAFDGSALDATGHGHDGTPNASVAYSPTVPAAIGAGTSLALNGGAWVDVPADAALNSTAFTLTFWIDQDGATQNGNFERVTSRGSDSFEVGVAANSSLSYYPSPGWRDTGCDLPRNGWRHVALVSDGSQMSLYVGGQRVSTNPFSGNPSGFLRIGARASVTTEGIEAKMDDVALWGHPLSSAAVLAMAGGLANPLDVENMVLNQTTVTSDGSQWQRSTVRRSGGPAGTWTPGADPLPDVSTFTEACTSATAGGIVAAAADLGVGSILGDGGAGQPTGLQYYRTTFDLGSFAEITAQITLAVDNGAQIFINGTEVARETSFLVENWARPYSTLSILADGTVDAVTLFDQVAPSFDGWRQGENELIIALRNPDSEALGGGGFAFQMGIVTTIPEPATCCLVGLGCLALARRRRRRRSA